MIVQQNPSASPERRSSLHIVSAASSLTAWLGLSKDKAAMEDRSQRQ
jgi:hypothetical protein